MSLNNGIKRLCRARCLPSKISEAELGRLLLEWTLLRVRNDCGLLSDRNCPCFERAFFNAAAFSPVSAVPDWLQAAIHDRLSRIRRGKESDDHVSRSRIPGTHGNAAREHRNLLHFRRQRCHVGYAGHGE